MLRKKEKKAITSIIALLIGWPVGLDQFLEGNNSKGIQSIIGWFLVTLFFFVGIGSFGMGDKYEGILLISALGGIAGAILIYGKLLVKLKAFEKAED